MTEAPPKRVDPPASFTGFIVILLCVLFGIFLWGISYQKLNFSLFPSDGTGMILNVLFIASLGLVLFMLFKFWMSWNFIKTIQCFIITSNIIITQSCPFRLLLITPLFISVRVDRLNLSQHFNIIYHYFRTVADYTRITSKTDGLPGCFQYLFSSLLLRPSRSPLESREYVFLSMQTYLLQCTLPLTMHLMLQPSFHRSFSNRFPSSNSFYENGSSEFRCEIIELGEETLFFYQYGQV